MKSLLRPAGLLALCATGAHAQLVENFDSIGVLPSLGWTIQNASFAPVGPGWQQGNPSYFAAHAGAPEAYASADFGATLGSTGPETISAWMVTPVVFLTSGDTIRFYTRTTGPVEYADRLQVRMSTLGASSVIPTTPTDVGSFTTVLLEVNATQSIAPYPTGYPIVWTQFTATVPQFPGTVACRVAFRYFVTGGGYQGFNSNYIGLDSLQIGNAPTGGCCLPDATCLVLTSSHCVDAGGVYQGDNSACGTIVCPVAPDLWIEQGDAGDLPGTAQVTGGTGTLSRIRGNIGANDVDMYQFRMCAPASFSATTVGGANFDTQLFLFTSSGGGIAFNDDAPQTGSFQSTISSQFTGAMAAGDVLLAVTRYNNDALASTQPIWLNEPVGVERAPDGPGQAGTVNGWSGAAATGGAYTIELTGSCYPAAVQPCYANCDASTTAPVLNVQDFTCFLQQYAASNAYANCDGSTVAPTLNVQDFTCFLQRYAAGCP
jgi:hypothetical protein